MVYIFSSVGYIFVYNEAINRKIIILFTIQLLLLGNIIRILIHVSKFDIHFVLLILHLRTCLVHCCAMVLLFDSPRISGCL